MKKTEEKMSKEKKMKDRTYLGSKKVDIEFMESEFIHKTELDEINRARIIIGLKPIKDMKIRSCLKCNREFHSRVYRLCFSCKKQVNGCDEVFDSSQQEVNL